MAWVYILRGASGRFYIGSTTDLNRRLEQHRNGQTYSTRRLGFPLELVDSLELVSDSDLLRQAATREVAGVKLAP